MTNEKSYRFGFRDTFFAHGYLLIIAAWLFTISFAVSNYWAFTATPQKVQDSFHDYLSVRENKFEQITNDSKAVSTLLTADSDKTTLPFNDKDFGLFVYEISDSGRLNEAYWSTFSTSVRRENLSVADGYYPYEGRNGFFELLKKSIFYKNKKYIVAALIPIKWKYLVENSYFRNSFANSSLLDNLYNISNAENAYPVYNSRHQAVFKIKKNSNTPSNYFNRYSVLLNIAAIVFILLFINGFINDITAYKGVYIGFVWLLIMFVGLYTVNFLCKSFLGFRSYEIFSPSIYASDRLNASLGDLLINALLFFWLTSFIKYKSKHLTEIRTRLTFQKHKEFWAIVCLFLFAFVTMECIRLISSLVSDSTIPLEVTDFFHLNIYTFIAFFILTLVVLSYFNLSYSLFQPARRAGFNVFMQTSTVAGSLLLIITVYHPSEIIFVELFGVIWLIIYCLIINIRQKDLCRPLIRSSYFLFWLMFFAASIAAVIRVSSGKEIKQNILMAQKIAVQTGNEDETLLKIAVKNFNDYPLDSDYYAQFYSTEKNKVVKDSLPVNNFYVFTNKYIANLYAYDSLRKPLYNSDSTSFEAMNAMTGALSKQTDIPNLYLNETDNGMYNFIYRKEIISDTGKKLQGYLFILITPKTFNYTTLPTELRHENRLLSKDINLPYSYAVYKNLHLIKNTNDYDLSNTISVSQIPKYGYQEIKTDRRKEFWYAAGNNIVVVLTEYNNDFIESVTLFAYLFLSFTVVIVLFEIAAFIMQSRFRWRIIKQVFQFKIRFQIHVALIFICLSSFVVISIFTISVFISNFRNNNQNMLAQNLQAVANEIQQSIDAKPLPAFHSLNGLNDFFNKNDIVEKTINIAGLNDVEANIYDMDGILQVSTQPFIYNKNLVSNRMQPNAYYQMKYKHRISFLQDETIGTFKYLSGYVPLYDNGKKVFGYLNIPRLHSESQLEQEISRFLVTIINLNALIFLLAGAVAGLLTLRITRSFAYIKSEMGKINLDKENEEIDWQRNDELGELVKEYNKMVNKLNESAKALAQSEREGAWKQMARQVAHEIKNPLTPMKLNLQFLQRAALNKNENLTELSQRVSGMLIEQIEQLTSIANDFSQYANIHNTHPELLDIKTKIHHVTMLYGTAENVKITFISSPENNFVYADKKQLYRAFSNLIKNAIEASNDNKLIEIFIEEKRVDNTVQISIKDNGRGIPEEQKDKLFIPNFTTKSSGTGLGLAISKGIIERAGGDIWFVSEINKGTTFFISLPLFKIENG